MRVEHGTLTAASKRLDYSIWAAEAAGRGLLLLHEGLGCVALWKGFPEALHRATGRPVLAYSRAGYGQSEADDLPRALHWMNDEAAHLSEVMHATGFRDAVLIGHSDGATIAAIRAGLWRDTPGVVLIAPHFFTETMGLAEIARAREVFETTDLRQRMAKYHRDAEATFRGWADRWLSPEFEAWNVAHVLDTLACPVLAIQGREDQYGTLAQIDIIADRAPGPVERRVLEGCKHSPHLEQPEVVLDEVLAFLKKYAL